MEGILLRAAAASLAACLLIPAALPAGEDERPEVVSLLGKELYARPAEGEALEQLKRNLAEAERGLKADPDNPEKIVAYGRSMAYLWRYHEAIEIYSKGIEQFPEYAMLYRHRGHRYISIREFGRAVDDLTVASLLEDSDFDIWYHLALAQYLQGDFAAAGQSWLKCLGSADDDDSLIAVSNWLYIVLRRQGKLADAEAVLARIHEDMEVVENGSYHALLLFYKGLRTEEQLREISAASELEQATIGYGLGCRHLYDNDISKAEEYFRTCISGSYWPAFGYISAEAELARAAER